MNKKLISLVSLILVVASLSALVAGCTGGKAATPSTVTLLVTSDPMVSWDPADSWAAEIVVLQNIYETLVRVDPADNNKVTGVLAESWQESADHLTWTFKLRKGVKFHSGKELTADMAVKSIQRTIDLKKGAYYIWDGVKEIKAVGTDTIQFSLSRPLPMLMITSSAYAAYIYNPEYDSKWYYGPAADGTGPFKFQSYAKDDKVILQKFDGYWGGWKDKNKFDYAIVRKVSEAATARQLLTSGDADLVFDLPPEDITALAKDTNLKIYKTDSFQVLSLFLNTEKPPLDNKLVRQALSYLMPYQDVINYILNGNAVQARGVLPPNLWGYGKDLFQYSYNPDKAKDLLAQAGYANGGLKFVYSYGASNRTGQKIAEMFKDSCAKVGITIELKPMATISTSYTQARDPNPMNRQDMMTLYWWPDDVDPYSYLFSQFHSEEAVGFNFSYYKNATVDKLMDDANALAGVSIPQATEKYIEAQKIIIDDAPVLFLFTDTYVRAARADLLGYKDNPAYATAVFFYELSKAPKK